MISVKELKQLPWSVWAISALLLIIYLAQSTEGFTDSYILNPQKDTPPWTAYTTQFLHGFGLHLGMNILAIMYYHQCCFKSNKEAVAFYIIMPLIIALPLYFLADSAGLGYSTITMSLMAIGSLKLKGQFLSINGYLIGMSIVLEIISKGHVSHMAHGVGWCAGALYWGIGEMINKSQRLKHTESTR